MTALGMVASAAVAQQIPITGETYAHDPSTIVQGTTSYYYSTGQGILSRQSTNLSSWSDGPAVFSTAPSWTTTAVPGFTGDFWAPEVSYFNNLYHLYYAVSTFSSQVSAIGMATSPTLNPSAPNYAWADQGPVIQSHSGSAYNTIDPSVITATNGTMWMSFGSYWTGIYEIQLNTSTGLVQSGATPIHLAQRAGSDTSDEASYLNYHNGYYYLFSNWGMCCQGDASTYNVRMGRSTSVNGPFVDAAGTSLLNGGGTLLMAGQGNYIGPGQVGIITQNGQNQISYHYYNGANNGTPAFALQDLYWTADGWPTTTQPLVWSSSTTSTTAMDGGGTWDLTHTHFVYNSTPQVWNSSGYGGVTFGNAAGAAGTVTLAQNVSVQTMTFNASGSGNYTLAGSGNTITIASGGTGGIITTNASATIAANIVAGNLTKLGTGTLTLTGATTATNLFPNQGTTTLAGTGSFTTATVPLSSADNYASVGQGPGNNGTLTVMNSSTLTIAGDFNIADVGTTGSAAVGVLNIQNNATVNARYFFVGKYGNANGTVNQSGGILQEADNGASSGDWRIGGAGSSADSAAVGTYNLSGGSLSTPTNFQVGAYGHGNINQSGGSVTVGGWISVGRFAGGVGSWNINSGSINNSNGGGFLIVGEQGTGTLSVGGSANVNANGLSPGYNNGGLGTVSQTGGTITLGSNGLQFGSAAASSGASAVGSFTLNGGTLITPLISINTASTVTGTFNFNGGKLDITGTGSNLPGTITVPASGTLELAGTLANPIVVSPGGIFVLDANTGSGILVRSLNTVTLSAGTAPYGQLSVLAESNRTNRQLIVTSGLNLAGGSDAWHGLVDLADNDLDVQNGNLANITNQIKEGFNNGKWNGPAGITSTSAAGDSAHLTALGVILNNNLYGTASGALGTFDTINPGAMDVLVKYTYFGDANINGKVDSSDYTRIDAGYLGKLTGWYDGDFNYDGVVNGSDYTLIDNAFNLQAAQITSRIANPVAHVASAVPEPTGLIPLLAVPVFVLTMRRGRRCSMQRLPHGYTQ